VQIKEIEDKSNEERIAKVSIQNLLNATNKKYEE
jgi:hypothetical protein